MMTEISYEYKHGYGTILSPNIKLLVQSHCIAGVVVSMNSDWAS